MAFKMSTQKSSGKISEVVIGTGDKAIKIGGENTLTVSITEENGQTVTYEKKYNCNDYKVKAFLNEIEKKIGYPMIVKARRGSFGAQVHLINCQDDIIELINKYDSNDIIFQE